MPQNLEHRSVLINYTTLKPYISADWQIGKFESLIKLHYSQTKAIKSITHNKFESLIKLHYSQTSSSVISLIFAFESLIKLHYSQTWAV